MFKNIDLSMKALDAYALRQEVIAHNLANVDTPLYKRKDVRFEKALEEAIKNQQTDTLDKIVPEVYTDLAAYSYRMDGNNVDIDREISESTKNEMRYNVMTQRTNAQISRYKYLLQNLK